VPHVPVAVNLRVHPGDSIAASVKASGASVLLRIRDLTDRRSFEKRLSFPGPDTSSAEWIAEAPSSCDRSGCNVLPLTNFGTVGFLAAGAQTADGQAGSISDPAWNTIPIEIQGDPEAFAAMASPAFDSATPSALGGAGSSFSITWQQVTAPEPPAPPMIGRPGGFI
jgi:hypothetical protein